MTRSVLEHFIITCSALSWLEVISLFRSVRKLIKGLLFLWNLCKVSCKKFPKWFIDYYSNKLECFLPKPNNTFSFSTHLKTCALMRETARNIKGGKEAGLISWFIEKDFTWNKNRNYIVHTSLNTTRQNFAEQWHRANRDEIKYKGSSATESVIIGFCITLLKIDKHSMVITI